jgi:hypothetical protein
MKSINQFIKNAKNSSFDTDVIHGGSASRIDAVMTKDVRRGNTEITVFT